MVAGIVWLSLTPSPPTVDFEASDKVGHLAAYGILMLWFCRLYYFAATRMLLGALFVAMGIGLEFAQGALGFRSYELLDMLANTAGVLLGWAAARMLPRPA